MRALGVGVGDDDRRPDQLAAHQPHADARLDRGDRHARRQHGAVLAGRVGERERHPAGAAAHVAPAAVGERAHGVHRVHAGGAGIARARPGADHALAVQQRAQPLVADVFLDDVGDRAVEEHVEGLRVVEQLGELGPVRARAHPGVAGAGAQRARGCVRTAPRRRGSRRRRRARARRPARACARRRRRRRSTCRRGTGTRGWGRAGRGRTRGGAGPAPRRPAGAAGPTTYAHGLTR